MSITPRRAALVTPLVLLGVALSGCGVADEQIRPGVAARVDGTDVTVSEVDDLATGTCTYLDSSEGATAFPRVTIRRLFLETLIRQEAAQALVDDLDVELPDDYFATVGELAQEYTDEPDDIADVMREGDEVRYYVAYATAAIGDALLREETGTEPGNADEISARGAQAINEWIAERDVDLNPTFGLRVEDGRFVADDGLSVAVSSQARDARGVADIDLSGNSGGDEGDLQAAVEQATAELPADQVCGVPGSAPAVPQG